MATLPSSLALTTISDGALATAADLRNNFTAVQTENNSLLTILGAGTAGDVFTGVGTTVQFAKPPGYEFAYNEFTAPVTISATTEATANTIVTASAVTFDGSTVAVVEFFAPSVQLGTTSGDQLVFLLYLDGASIGIISQSQLAPAGGAINPARATRRLTPASGSRTYSVRAYKVGTGNGTVTAGAGGTPAIYLPGFIRITKV